MMPVVYVVVMALMIKVVVVLKLVLQAVIMPVDLLQRLMIAAFAVVVMPAWMIVVYVVVTDPPVFTVWFNL
jgi:hypothetical protein